ncbi:MAG: transcriptional regulator [Spirochaetae bacterium HGW-Spirochaetae-10]|nr:MAG: transcriptional regulator [Spirochaetae bacterium HGW-Spirochaetae-10]
MTALKNLTPAKAQAFAAVFAALGDETRLSIVARLADGRPQSISTLTANTELTRQAVSRHLRVLEDVGLVQSKRSGRETLFEIDLRPFKDMNDYMNLVSSKWDQALGRLKSFVEQ